ncbi:uncharacterized protein CELE_ZK262.20 [Caenorhabditis elegans]|uniref:Secreted protein n=1 Tax=Caenorhabditis elegans TaxID=6239 RepID=H9G365_CAEEL|nr:Secreted protein [Caenorhabditis elegans]CCG28179.1 Secreted protein [Caenorhabditis elegans]|eukprot:NP_001256799.1 Uncharacterized protein CELE_ZK262.20 [Caenorhabditis elegans]
MRLANNDMSTFNIYKTLCICSLIHFSVCFLKIANLPQIRKLLESNPNVSNSFNNNAIDNKKAYLFSNCSVNISQVAELNLDSLDLSLDEYESLVLKMIAGHQAEIKKLQKKLADVRTNTSFKSLAL